MPSWRWAECFCWRENSSAIPAALWSRPCSTRSADFCGSQLASGNVRDRGAAPVAAVGRGFGNRDWRDSRRASPGLIVGLVVLAGHFQTALYAFFALALFVALIRGPLARRALVIGAAVVIGFLLSAVQVLPGLELTAQSGRATATYRTATNAPLIPPRWPRWSRPIFTASLRAITKVPAISPSFISTVEYSFSHLRLRPLDAESR